MTFKKVHSDLEKMWISNPDVGLRDELTDLFLLENPDLNVSVLRLLERMHPDRHPRVVG